MAKRQVCNGLLLPRCHPYARSSGSPAGALAAPVAAALHTRIGDAGAELSAQQGNNAQGTNRPGGSDAAAAAGNGALSCFAVPAAARARRRGAALPASPAAAPWAGCVTPRLAARHVPHPSTAGAVIAAGAAVGAAVTAVAPLLGRAHHAGVSSVVGCTRRMRKR